jgi:hemolysin-activating ACP:hemolysin acyltransferase
MNVNSEAMAIYGEAVRLLGRSNPGMTILETERCLWYPIALRQFECIRHKHGGMVGFAVWAFMPPSVVEDFPIRRAGDLELEEWNEGTLAVVMALACQPRDARRLGRAVLKRLGATHEEIYYQARASDGEAMRLRHFPVRNALHSAERPHGPSPLARIAGMSNPTLATRSRRE